VTEDDPVFDDNFRARLRELFAWRRDVRRFRTDPLPADLVRDLIEAACLAPSVGLSQPWRFVLVEDEGRRGAIIENFNRCNREALETYGPDRAGLYARLKLAGLVEAPCHLAIFADEATPSGHGLGRRTMPEMLLYSVVTAIANLWLAARAAGVGMGWVSVLEPGRVSEVLDTPPAWRLIGYFCLGYPDAASDTPELETEGWERRCSGDAFIVVR
jgi:5,6-dimethylbenzimidazole synthase